MLLAVVLVGSAVLTITSIAGYLTLQRIRMSSNFTDSAKAIFAADAGLECEFYRFFKSSDIDCNNLSFTDPKTKIQTVVEADQYIKSIGTSNKATRAFISEFKK